MAQSNPPKLTTVIPCLNERNTIGRCIADIRRVYEARSISGEIIVSDNGSTDGSQDIAESLGARVIAVTERGYGVALDEGIREATGDIVAFADADLSYNFSDLPRLVQPIIDDQADFVLGSRYLGEIEKNAMPVMNRYIGTPILSFLIRELFSVPTSDCNSGMRAIRRSCYSSMGLRSQGMEFASEMLVKISGKNIRYAEVPISFSKDKRGRRSHLRPLRDGCRHLRVIMSESFISFR